MSEPSELRISPNALCSVERARAYLQKDATAQDYEIASAIDAATSVMELFTHRRLRERWYCSPIAKTGVTITTDSPTLTGTGLTSSLKVGMDAFNAGLGYGSRILSITDAANLVLTIPAVTGAAAQAVSFGSAEGPLEFFHDGGRKILFPEYPLNEVTSLKVIGTDGTITTISLTNSLIRSDAGILLCGDESPAKGDLLRAEFRAGYQAPSSLSRAHEREWIRLERLCLRITQVLWQDFRLEIGRSLEMSLRDQTIRFTDLKLPSDITEGLLDFVREEI